MPIRFYEGIEGSGKTCMLTKDLALHYKSGGAILAAPGYTIFNPKNKKPICQTLKLEQLVNFHETIGHKRAIIVFDEVSNWFNNHTWQNKLCDLIGAFCQQRRKLQAGIYMTGHDYEELPLRVKTKVHELIHCEDKHRRYRALKRGLYCSYYHQDMRGGFCHPGRPFSRRRTFFMSPWFDWYDTFEVTNFINQFTRFEFAKKVVKIDEFGNVINPNDYGESDVESLREYIKQQKETVDPLIKAVQRFFQELNGVTKIPRDVVYKYFKSETKAQKDKIGRILHTMGVKSADSTKDYILP